MMMRTFRLLVCWPMVLLPALFAATARAHNHRIKIQHIKKGGHHHRRQEEASHSHDTHTHRTLGAGTSNFGGWHQHAAGQKCSTHDPSAEAVESSNRLARQWLDSKGGGRRILQDLETIVLPVCFHVIRPDGDTATDFLNTASLQEQLDALNRSFSSQSCCDTNQFWCNGECSIDTALRFEMAVLSADDGGYVSGSTTSNVADASVCVTRTVNDDWYFADTFSETEKDMKRTLRVGDATVLNIYYKSFADGTLGYATFPSEFTREGDVDGVIIDDSTIVGGVSIAFNEGVSIADQTNNSRVVCLLGLETAHTSSPFHTTPFAFYFSNRTLLRMRYVRVFPVFD